MLQSEELEELPIPEELLSREKKDAYANFLEAACRDHKTNLIYLTFPVKCEDPLRWFNNHYTNDPFHFYWETPSHSSAIAAIGAVHRLSFEGAGRFRALENALQKANSGISTFDFSVPEEGQAPRWVGGFSFFPEISPSAWNGFQPACFTLPKAALIKEDEGAAACISLAINDNSTPEKLHQKLGQQMQLFLSKNGKDDSSTSHKKKRTRLLDGNNQPEKWELQQWARAIDDAKKQFQSQKLEKVVLTRQNPLLFDRFCDPVDTLFKLRGHYPKGCSFLIKNEGSPAFLGCSPEQLLSTRNRFIETEALAGSIARGKNEGEDKALAQKLLASSKDQQEHAFVIQSIQEQLSPFLAEWDIPGQPVVKKLPNVQHLYTPVRGRMKEDATVLKLVDKLHPTPAVGGTPRSRALSFIRNKEPFERGWFAGPIGWITSSGRAEFYVAIRSGLIDKQQALLFAGCGIVADSEPKAEWEEANLKFKPMLSALNDE